MSIVEDLQKLDTLHRSGALSDGEFEAAKARALAVSTVPHEPPAPVAASRVANKQTPQWITWFVALALVLGVGWMWLRQTVGERAATQLVRAAVHAPISLRDEVQSLPASSWKALGLSLPYTGSLSLTLEVARGNPVDVMVMDEENLRRLKNKEPVQHFSEFEAVKSRTYQRTARLEQGTYYVVLRDKTLGILSSSSSDVRVSARLEP